MNYRLKKISSDASFREFYRVKKNKKTSIIVLARKEQYKNLIVYSVVNKILSSHNILSPKLIKNYYKDNMIEITDLGDKSFYDYIVKWFVCKKSLSLKFSIAASPLVMPKGL